MGNERFRERSHGVANAAHLEFAAYLDRRTWESGMSAAQTGTAVGGFAVIGTAIYIGACVATGPVGLAALAASAVLYTAAGTVGGAAVAATGSAIVTGDAMIRQCQNRIALARLARMQCESNAENAHRDCLNAADAAQDNCLANQP